MEYITEDDLKECESLIEAINQSNLELAKAKKKQLELKHRLFALELCRITDQSFKDKLVHGIVKIFHSIFDLHKLYEDVISEEEFNNLCSHKNHSFCFVEINIVKELLEKLTLSKWMLCVTLGTGAKKMVRLIKICEDTCSKTFVVLPYVPSKDYADVLAISLRWMNDTLEDKWKSFCLELHVSTIPIDISYYFTPQSFKKTSKQIHQTLNPCDKPHKLNSVIQCKFSYKQPFEKLFKSIMRNSYHNIDPRNVGVFLRNKDERDVKIQVNNGSNICMKLNENLQQLTINTPAVVMVPLIEYLVKEFDFDINAFDRRKTTEKLKKVQKKIESIQLADADDDENVERSLRLIDEELRNIMSNYPL